MLVLSHVSNNLRILMAALTPAQVSQPSKLQRTTVNKTAMLPFIELTSLFHNVQKHTVNGTRSRPAQDLVPSSIEVLADRAVVLQVVSDVLYKCLNHHHSG